MPFPHRYVNSQHSLFYAAFQKIQGGMIGISLDTQWYEPYSNSSEDIAATERARSFYVNW